MCITMEFWVLFFPYNVCCMNRYIYIYMNRYRSRKDKQVNVLLQQKRGEYLVDGKLYLKKLYANGFIQFVFYFNFSFMKLFT